MARNVLFITLLISLLACSAIRAAYEPSSMPVNTATYVGMSSNGMSADGRYEQVLLNFHIHSLATEMRVRIFSTPEDLSVTFVFPDVAFSEEQVVRGGQGHLVTKARIDPVAKSVTFFIREPYDYTAVPQLRHGFILIMFRQRH